MDIAWLKIQQDMKICDNIRLLNYDFKILIMEDP